MAGGVGVGGKEQMSYERNIHPQSENGSATAYLMVIFLVGLSAATSYAWNLMPKPWRDSVVSGLRGDAYAAGENTSENHQQTASSEPIVVCGEVRQFSPDVFKWIGLAAKHARSYEIELWDLLTLIQIESGGNEKAVSKAGAAGLTQVIFYWHSGRLLPEEEELGSQALFKPDTNMRVGAEYFSELRDMFPGEPAAWYAAYNGGPYAGRWFSQSSAWKNYGESDYKNELRRWVDSEGKRVLSDKMIDDKANEVRLYVERALAWREVGLKNGCLRR
jgi:soluble lytic murein transglycosylase-like protein